MSSIFSAVRKAQKIANQTTEVVQRMRKLPEEARKDALFLVDLINDCESKKQRTEIRDDIYQFIQGSQEGLNLQIANYKAGLQQMDAENTETLEQLCLFDLDAWLDEDTPDPPEPESLFPEGEVIDVVDVQEEDIIYADPIPRLALGPAKTADDIEDAAAQEIAPDPIEQQKTALGNLAENSSKASNLTDFKPRKARGANRPVSGLSDSSPIA